MSFATARIGDVLTFQRGFDITKAEQTDGEIPIVSSSGTSSHHNHWKVAGPGIVIGRKGTLGTTYFLKSNFWPHDTTLWIKDFKGNDPRLSISPVRPELVEGPRRLRQAQPERNFPNGQSGMIRNFSITFYRRFILKILIQGRQIQPSIGITFTRSQ